MTLLLFSCKQEVSDPAIYLIPDGYIGEVVVVYNHPNGQEEMYEGEKRLYVIPKTGVLKTKFTPTYGLIYDQYFYVDASQNKKEIFQEHKVEDADDICIYNGMTGKKKIENETYNISAFMVCKKDAIKHFNEFKFESKELNKL
ncbi:DUF6843 domain-containing protein [Aquimarina celericrescens]|uniref:DUF6843 domain-containing protein n=1 Tax=Aquimarina celericrescens TaxID=1964542 RepID=A0ABW5AUF3_9FLAO|nr:hypothetical protein [Aquimarina celericrescens]